MAAAVAFAATGARAAGLGAWEASTPPITAAAKGGEPNTACTVLNWRYQASINSSARCRFGVAAITTDTSWADSYSRVGLASLAVT